MDFGPALYPGSWPGLGRVRGWIRGGWGSRGFVDSGVRGRRSSVRGFVDPWGVRGFVNGFVHSWVRELVAGFVDWFARFRVRGVSFRPKRNTGQTFSNFSRKFFEVFVLAKTFSTAQKFCKI